MVFAFPPPKPSTLALACGHGRGLVVRFPDLPARLPRLSGAVRRVASASFMVLCLALAACGSGPYRGLARGTPGNGGAAHFGRHACLLCHLQDVGSTE